MEGVTCMVVLFVIWHGGLAPLVGHGQFQPKQGGVPATIGVWKPVRTALSPTIKIIRIARKTGSPPVLTSPSADISQNSRGSHLSCKFKYLSEVECVDTLYIAPDIHCQQLYLRRKRDREQQPR